jgi:hypothetical protein
MFPYAEELQIIEDALDTAGIDIEFRPADRKDIAYLRGMLYPGSVIAFYEQAEPNTWVEIKGVMLNTVADMWGENEDNPPGVFVVPLGYLNVASTDTDDTYCIDINSIDPDGQPAVVAVPHDHIFGDQSDDEIRKTVIPVAGSFREFLRLFAQGELPQIHQQSWAA